MVSCSVPGCRNNLAKSQLRFFCFPSDSHRHELWRAFTKREKFLLPKYPRICEVHFDTTQFELKRKDGWRKLKWTAVPTLHPPPPDLQLSKKQERLRSAKKQLENSLKLADGNEEFQSDINAASVDFSADTVAGIQHGDKQECEVKTLRKLGTFGVIRETGIHVVRDKKVLKSLLNTITENIRKVSYQLQETTNRKCQLMQLVKNLLQEEITLQRRLKKESDKENVVKLQLQEIEDAEIEDYKAEDPCCKDALMQQNDERGVEKEDWKVEEPCYRTLGVLIQTDNCHVLQISAQKENDVILRESSSAAKQMELKLFDGLVALSNVDDVKFDSLEAESDEKLSKSGDGKPSLLKSSSNLTYSSDMAQADDITMFAESVAEETERVECDSLDEATRTVCNIACVETRSLSDPSISLQRKHICSFCGERFWNTGARQNHELTHGKEFRCNICDKVFSYRAGLINHKRTHSDEKPFSCMVCDRRFKTNGTLKRHFRSHTREKHYACSVCSETFFYAHQRQVHMSVHTGKQPYVCKECGRGFSSSNCLTRHVLIHRGEKPFECNVCGKRFRQGNQVKAHKEMHGEKPYVCFRCGKRLGLGSFWNHMREHSNIKKKFYECAVCDKKLTTKKTLEMHTRMVHMGEAPYVCNVCYQEFGKYKDFKLHKKEHSHQSSS